MNTNSSKVIELRPRRKRIGSFELIVLGLVVAIVMSMGFPVLERLTGPTVIKIPPLPAQK